MKPHDVRRPLLAIGPSCCDLAGALQWAWREAELECGDDTLQRKPRTSSMHAQVLTMDAVYLMLRLSKAILPVCAPFVSLSSVLRSTCAAHGCRQHRWNDSLSCLNVYANTMGCGLFASRI